MQKIRNSLLLDITSVIIGLVILLFGMHIVSMVSMSVFASYLNIIPLYLSLSFLVRSLHIEQYIGSKGVSYFYVLIFVLTLFGIIYSSVFVYNDYLNGRGELCAHSEHVWFYDNILSIARFTPTEWNQGALADLHLGKYQNLAVYGSLFLRFGGDIPTNMCVWSAFNLSLVAFLVVLSSVKLGLEDKRNLFFIMLLCLLQPYLDMLFACHRDGYGESAILLGFYIFVCTYKKPTQSIIAFPFYAFLFWTFRAQYILIAIALFFWSSFHVKRQSSNLILGVVIVIAVSFILIRSIDVVDYLKTDLYVGGYEVAQERASRSLLNMILISTLGYFPWPNLINDYLWPWQLFAVFQGAMNLVIIYFMIKTYKNKWKQVLENPTIFTGMLLFAASIFVPGHMAYTVVAIPFLAASIKKVSFERFFRVYGTMILIVLLLGLFYSVLGLSGSRAIA